MSLRSQRSVAQQSQGLEIASLRYRYARNDKYLNGQLITAIANDLAPQIRPKYFVSIEERVYQMSGEESLLVGVPDVLVQRSQTTANLFNF